MTAVRAGVGAARVLAATLSAVVTGALVRRALEGVAGNRMAPWIIGRASGVCAYLLLVAVVLVGLVLSHPSRSRLRRPSAVARIRIHVVLSVLALGSTGMHVVILATDRNAGVGWWGVVVPAGASYRPAAVTLGVIGLWIAVFVGLSAALAGRLPHRLWWPVHRVACVSLVLVWLHGVLAGGDTTALRGIYLATGGLVVLVAASRYLARTPNDVTADRA